MEKQDAKKTRMRSFSRNTGWDTPCEYFADYSDAGSHEAYGKMGYSLADELGNAMGWSFSVYEKGSGTIRFLVDVCTPNRGYAVAIPTMPDLLEFMRLYLPVIEAMQRFSDREADEVGEEIRRLRRVSRAVQPKV